MLTYVVLRLQVKVSVVALTVCLLPIYKSVIYKHMYFAK